MVKAVSKLLEETTTKLDGLFTACMDELRDELDGNIGQIHIDLDKYNCEGVSAMPVGVVTPVAPASSII